MPVETLTPYDKIKLANERTRITDACTLIGMHTPDFDFGTQKVYCPFGEIYHADGGIATAFRIYPVTNSAWCFACSKYYSPTILVSLARGITEEEAALLLLERSGWTPPDPLDRWDKLIDQPMTFDKDSEREALKLFCGRIDPDWEVSQFDSDKAKALSACFTPLSKVTTQEQLMIWRATVRRYMRSVLQPSIGDTHDQ